MRKYSAAGDAVHVLVICGGSTARHHQLREAAYRSSQILGIAEPQFLDHPENRTDAIPLLDLIAPIEQFIRAVGPTKIFAPHPGNLNIDHRRTFEAVATACRPVPGTSVREFATYEIASSTDWSPPAGAFQPFSPNLFVDIAADLELKLTALSYYGGEMRPSPHARSVDAVRALAVHRSMGVGLAAAEAFSLLRRIE